MENPGIDELRGYGELILKQIQLQMEVRDRWFHYFLLVTTATLAFATSILGVFSDRWDDRVLYVTAGAALIFAAVLGVLFFNLYLRQRQNYTRHFRVLQEIHRQLAERVLEKEWFDYYPSRTASRRGADWFTLAIEALVTSVFFATGVAITRSGWWVLGPWTVFWAVATFIISLAGLWLVKRSADRAA